MRAGLQAFMVSTALAAAAVPAWGQASPRQAAAPSVAFEVASVKPATEPATDLKVCLVPCRQGERFTVEHSRVEIRYMSLDRLILTAYRIKPYQLTGPDWMGTAKFDIEAKMPEGASREQMPEMLQALLAERFKLAIHRDSKELPVYALVVGKNGPKLQAGRGENIDLPNGPGSQELYTPEGEARTLGDGAFVTRGGPLGPVRGGRGSSGGLHFEFLNLTMPALADLVAPHMDRPVVDQTEVKGSYYWDFQMHPPSGDGVRKSGGDGDGGRTGGVPDAGQRADAYGEAIFAAIEKAGLRLEKTKAPVETIVVDRLEKTPTEN
jgi:uncharacterized protein (TIGR03435 family)